MVWWLGDAGHSDFQQAFGVITVLSCKLGAATSHHRSWRASSEIFGLPNGFLHLFLNLFLIPWWEPPMH